MGLNEAQCTKELRDSLLEEGHFFYKIPDSYDMQERPFDGIFCYSGKFVAIECKFQRSFKAFGMSAIRDSQIRNLDAVVRAGGISLVVLFIRGNIDNSIEGRYNRMYTFDWEFFKTMPTSIKKPTLLQLQYDKGYKKRYELELLLNHLKIDNL